MHDKIVVVPCYNEEHRLRADQFLEFAHDHPSISFLMVDDGSSDCTRYRLDTLAALCQSQFAVLAFDQNQGKAEAVRQGMLAALERNVEAVAFWDADLATPLDSIVEMAEIIERQPQVEIVFGTRMRLLGHRIERRPLRRLLGRGFARVASLILGLQIYDTQCGAKMFRCTTTLRNVLSDRFRSRWIFDVELLARWLQATVTAVSPRASLYELPLAEWREVDGSKVKLRDFVRAVDELIRIAWYHRVRRSGVAAAASPVSQLSTAARVEPDRAEPERRVA